jgi:hypothetical protein
MHSIDILPARSSIRPWLAQAQEVHLIAAFCQRLRLAPDTWVRQIFRIREHADAQTRLFRSFHQPILITGRRDRGPAWQLVPTLELTS